MVTSTQSYVITSSSSTASRRGGKRGECDVEASAVSMMTSSSTASCCTRGRPLYGCRLLSDCIDVMRGRPTTRFAGFRSRLRTGASFIDDEDYSDDLTADIINGLVEITGERVEKLIDLRG